MKPRPVLDTICSKVGSFALVNEHGGRAAIFVLASVGFAGAAHSAALPGFKEVQLGTSYQAVAKTRKLSCFKVEPHVYSNNVLETRALRKQEAFLSLHASAGDTWCTVVKPGTVGGMKIVEMRLEFLDKTLGAIRISIAERGKSTPNMRGGGTWHSSDLTTLADTLVSRYGAAARQQYTDCSGRRGFCRGAPTKNVLDWSPDGATISFKYWQDTTGPTPELIFISKDYHSKQKTLAEKAREIDLRADAIEKQVADRRLKKRSSDI